jgi:hypothetical protein
VELFGDDSKLVRVLNRAETKVKEFGKGIMSFGGKIMAGGVALAAPLVGALKSFSEWGSQLNDMSARTGMSVESLSELAYAAGQTGASAENLEVGLNKMNKVLKGADDESKASQRSLAALGFTFEDLEGMSPEAKFNAIAARLAGISDPSKKAAVAMELFGRSGTMLIPMIDDMSNLRAEAVRLGQTMTTAEATSADNLGDSLDQLWGSIRGGAAAIGGALGPAVTELARKATEFIASLANWIRNNKDLVMTFAKVAAIVVGVGAAILGAGAVVYGIGVAFGVLASIVSGVGTVLGAVAGVFGFLVSLVGAILSPLGLLIGGLAAIIGYFAYTGQLGEYLGGALNRLGEVFSYLKGIAIESWDAINAAIASGDLGAAMNVVWTTIKMLWQEGISWLYGKWVAFKGWFLDIWNAAVYGTAMLMTEAWAGLQRTWVSVVASMERVWILFSTAIANSFDTVVNTVGGLMFDAMAKLGLIKQEEAEGAKSAVDTLTKQKMSQRSINAVQQIGAIDADAKARKQKITADEKASLAGLTSEMSAKDKARKEELDKDVEAAKEAAAKAKQERDEALEKAKAGAGKGGKPAEKPQKPGEFSGVDVTGKAKTEVSGTFSGFALSGLGAGGGFAEATAMHTKNSAAELRRIRQDGVKVLATA